MKIATSLMHTYWRWKRGLTIGVQCCLIDEDDQILLVRHGYRPGWHFPGGGVEKGETLAAALNRELLEEVAVTLQRPADLFAAYSNFKHFRGDHIFLFVSEDWQQAHLPEPNFEIAELKRFPATELPSDIHPPTAVRIKEILENLPPSEHWHTD